jgi:hypothetical protein
VVGGPFRRRSEVFDAEGGCEAVSVQREVTVCRKLGVWMLGQIRQDVPKRRRRISLARIEVKHYDRKAGYS